jgi:chromosome segregation ATPase
MSGREQELISLKQRADRLRKGIDEAKAKIQVITEDMDKEFGVSTVEGANKLLKKLRGDLEKARTRMDTINENLSTMLDEIEGNM